jgi:signal peptidase I
VTGRVLREVALTGGAVVGTLCLAFMLLGATVGVRPLVFTSGSMSPAIRTGDLAVTRPVETTRVARGDVVSVVDGRGERVTHRVVEVDAARNLLRLKGDANDVPDPLPYVADRVDLVLFSVPAGGYVLAWLPGPIASMLLGAYLVFLLWVLWPRGKARRAVGSTAAGVALVADLLVGGVPRPEPTLAAWTDAVPVSGTTLTAYTVPKPVITSCSANLFAVTVTWTAATSPYALTYQAVVAETGQALTVTANGTTRSTVYPTALQTVAGATRTVQITAALANTPSWTSVAARQTVRFGLAGVAPTCGAAS